MPLPYWYTLISWGVVHLRAAVLIIDHVNDKSEMSECVTDLFTDVWNH